MTDTTDDHDVSFAAAAFAAALPPFAYRPDQQRAPRRHRRAPAALAVTATAATVAIVTTVVMAGGGGTPAAWSATPKTLSSSAATKLDRGVPRRQAAGDARRPPERERDQPRSLVASEQSTSRPAAPSRAVAAARAASSDTRVESRTDPGRPRLAAIGDLPSS